MDEFSYRPRQARVADAAGWEAFAARFPEQARYAETSAGPDLLVQWADLARRDPSIAGNLVIIGSTGTRKTTSALAAIRPAAEAGFRVRWSNMANLITQIDAAFRSAHEVEATEADVWVLDDLAAAGTLQSNVSTALYRIVNTRVERNRPFVVTANRDLDVLVPVLGHQGDSIRDRLTHRAKIVRMFGESYRGTA